MNPYLTLLVICLVFAIPAWLLYCYVTAEYVIRRPYPAAYPNTAPPTEWVYWGFRPDGRMGWCVTIEWALRYDRRTVQEPYADLAANHAGVEIEFVT